MRDPGIYREREWTWPLVLPLSRSGHWAKFPEIDAFVFTYFGQTQVCKTMINKKSKKRKNVTKSSFNLYTSQRGRKRYKKRGLSYSKRFGYKRKQTSVKAFHKYLNTPLSSIRNSSIVNNSVFPCIYELRVNQRFKGKYTGSADNNDSRNVGFFVSNSLKDSLQQIGNRITPIIGFSKTAEARGTDKLAGIYNRYVCKGTKVTIKLSHLNRLDSSDLAPSIVVNQSNIKRVDAIKVWFDAYNGSASAPLRARTLQEAIDRKLHIMTLYPLKAYRGKNTVTYSFYVDHKKFAAVDETTTVGEKLCHPFTGNLSASNSVRIGINVTDEEGNPILTNGETGLQFEMDINMVQYIACYNLVDQAD